MDSLSQWLIKMLNSAVEWAHRKQRTAHFSRWAVPHSVHITQTKSMDIDEIIRKWVVFQMCTLVLPPFIPWSVSLNLAHFVAHKT
jgi:hypothetical protein